MDQPLLEHALHAAEPFIERYGYLGIFGAVFVEGFGAPAPGQTMIIAGSLLAADGELDLALVLGLSWAAAVLGDNVGYAIGHFGGHKLLLRYGKRVGLRADRLARVEAIFDERGGWIVMVARFFDVLRQLNGIVAGSTGMHWWRFVMFNAIGAALWVGVWGFGSYRLGRHISAVLNIFKRFEPFAISIGIAGLVALVVYLSRRNARS